MIYCGVPNLIPHLDYPDEWYQGIVSFNDSIWKVNISTGEISLLLEETNTDIIKPFLSPNEDYFIFINKKDNTLWSFKLK